MKLTNYGICLYFFLLIFLNCADANAFKSYTPLTTDPFLEPWRWRHFHELDGKGIRSITEGDSGKIWFSANQGVYEYDGYSFNLHDSADGLSGLPVKDIITTNKNNIYCSTSHGIFRFNGKKWNNIFPYSSPSFNVSTIKEIEDHGIFCLTQIGLIRIIDSNQFQVFTSLENIKKYSDIYEISIQWIALPDFIFKNGQQNFTDIIRDNKGYYWLCFEMDDEGHILKFKQFIKKGSFTRDYILVSSTNNLDCGSNQKLLKDNRGAIWIINGSIKTGIHVFYQNQHKYIKLSDKFGGDEFHYDIFQNKKGEIIVTGLGRFFVYQQGEWKYYSSEEVPVPPSCRIIIYETKNENLWIGGLQNEIFKLDYSDKKWLTYKGINYQGELPNGEQWFLSSRGRAIVRKDNEWKSFGTEDGLMDTPVRLICTRTGQVWVAGSHNGIAATAYLADTKWKLKRFPELSWSIDYRSVFESADSSLWFGGAVDYQRDKGQKNGIIHLLNPLEEKKKWKHYYVPRHGNMSLNTYGIAQSPDGTIWKGGLGLSYFDGSKWFQLNQPDELKDYVNTVHSRLGTNMYAGSRYYGLFIYDGEGWTVHNSSSGLTSNSIISIFCKSDSNIWVATDNGISHYNGRQWTSDMFPVVMNMTMEGGSVFMDSQKRLWINKSPREWKRRAFEFSKTPNDVFEKFKTYRYIADKGKPKTYLIDYPEEIPSTGQVTFFWDGKDKYKSTPDNKLKYKYQLDDGEWSDYLSNNHVTFYNLKPGEHVFKLKAIDMDLNVQDSSSMAAFTVSPPIYYQTWFIMLISGMIIISAIFLRQIIIRDKKLQIANKELNQVNEVLTDQKEKINSQKEQLNQMLLKNQQLAQSRIRFYTNISHEFRTPLTLILGYLDNLFLKEISYEKRQGVYNVIWRNANRLLHLINQLLEFRKIESGTLKLHVRKGDLVRFIRDLSDLFSPLANNRDIRFEFINHIDCFNTYFDHDKIEKIVFNLLSNAFKHCPNGEKIQVIMNKTHCGDAFPDSPANEKHCISITVSDTGKGINQEQLKHIFERYYMAARDEISMNQSSGIGLSYIKDLVEIHHGVIQVKSKEGEGSSFIVYIPHMDKPSEDSEIIIDKYMDQYHFSENTYQIIREMSKSYVADEHEENIIDNIDKQLKSDDDTKFPVLIVEDNSDMRNFLYNNLIKKYNVYEAGNGEEALKLVSKHEFEVIISDIMMPEMDGIEFCKRIKSNINTSHIPVILLTAKSLEEHEIEGYETGADDYIIKPFNNQLLNIRIQNIIENRIRLKEKFSNEFTFEPKEVKLPSSEKEFLKKLVNIMEEHLSEPDFNIEKMSKMMYISRSHFIRKVKNLTGQKPLELLMTYRLKRARQLLSQQEISVSEIAYQVGYDNPSSFTRTFKSKYGISPTEFMQSNN